MKKWHRIVVSLLASLLLATVLSLGAFSHPPVAHAGSAGQQIYFTISDPACVSGQLQSVIMVGQNQKHKDVSLSWPQGSIGTNVTAVITNGWWWRGSVLIYYEVNGTWQTTWAFIPDQADPAQLNQDTSYVTCQGTRTWTGLSYSIEGNDLNLCYSIGDNHFTGLQHFEGYEYLGYNGANQGRSTLVNGYGGKSYILPFTVIYKYITWYCDIDPGQEEEENLP